MHYHESFKVCRGLPDTYTLSPQELSRTLRQRRIAAFFSLPHPVPVLANSLRSTSARYFSLLCLVAIPRPRLHPTLSDSVSESLALAKPTNILAN
eukprot:4216287-Pleurochrysis_carterae.AAC.1